MSRILFNEKGVQSATFRQIAMALEMSQGNLNYHFKTKEALVEALYFELVEKIDEEMKTMTATYSMLSMLYTSAQKSMLIFYEYRFLLRDIYLIFREHEKIKHHYLGLQEFRKKQFLGLFESMIAQGVLRKEEFDGEYERLYERMNIIGDNWINAAGLFKGSDETVVAYYHQLLFEVIYPYLTEKGKAEFLELWNK